MRARDIRNLLTELPPAGPVEHFESLLARPGLRVERIVSHGHITPPGEWYDQTGDEWVIVLSGAARLLIEGEAEVELGPMDAIFLPAHARHRVTFTAADQPTVWLAVHYQAAAKNPGTLRDS